MIPFGILTNNVSIAICVSVGFQALSCSLCCRDLTLPCMVILLVMKIFSLIFLIAGIKLKIYKLTFRVVAQVH